MLSISYQFFLLCYFAFVSLLVSQTILFASILLTATPGYASFWIYTLEVKLNSFVELLKLYLWNGREYENQSYKEYHLEILDLKKRILRGEVRASSNNRCGIVRRLIYLLEFQLVEPSRFGPNDLKDFYFSYNGQARVVERVENCSQHY